MCGYQQLVINMVNSVMQFVCIVKVIALFNYKSII